jgi:hypothetical protein
VVVYSIERVIAVYFPMSRFKKSRKWRLYFFILTPLLVAVAFYSWEWQMSGIEIIEFQMRCVTKLNWFYIAEKLGLCDIVLTIFAPFLIISAANVLISLKLMKSVISRGEDQNIENYNQNEEAVVQSIENVNTVSRRATQSTSHFSSSSLRFNLSISAIGQRKQSYTKTTRNLIVISTVYLFLNAPIALSKVRYFVANLLENAARVNQNITVFDLNNFSNNSIFISPRKYNSTNVDELIERLTCYLYYLNFAINFLLYRFNGSKLISSILKLVKVRRN